MRRYLLQNTLVAKLENEVTIQRGESLMSRMGYTELRISVTRVLFQLERDVGERGNQVFRRALVWSCMRTGALHQVVESRSFHKVDLGGWVLQDGAHHWEKLLGKQGCDDPNMETGLAYFDVMKNQIDC
jgi:hypothetical protein